MRIKFKVFTMLILCMLLSSVPCFAAKKTTSVTLNYREYVLKPKSTLKLNAKCFPAAVSQKVKWKSTKSSVAKVSSNGKITAMKNGTSTIYALAMDGSGKKASCKIKVTNKIKKITKITLKTSKKTIYVGDTITGKITLLPKNPTLKSLMWTSSNTQVATVTQSGRIKGLHPGTAKITAMSQDGSKKKAVITITVKKKTIKPSVAPSVTPSHVPSATPSHVPSVTPSHVPSVTPSHVPSATPSHVPSVTPSHIPSVSPSESPSVKPSEIPSVIPSQIPSKEPVYVSAKKELDGYYCYELDTTGKATKYEVRSYDSYGVQTIYQSDGQVLNDARNGLLFGAGLDGKFTKEEFKKLFENGKISNITGLFGITSFKVTGSNLSDSKEDYIILEAEKQGEKKTIVLNSLSLISNNTTKIDLYGNKTPVTRFYFELEVDDNSIPLYVDLLGNGNGIFIYNSDGKEILFRLQFGENYNTKKDFGRVSISKSFVNILPNGVSQKLPDFNKLEVYNVYEEL